jgi:hypothetical protein
MTMDGSQTSISACILADAQEFPAAAIRTYHFAMPGADSSGNPVEVTPEKAFIEQTP